ncbi:MAG: thiol:disulfide interchange protein DsbA/DsbL [Proteobacteria bacterium]|nr:thiol:disulfide interchange protein DsbA/DsbL [Pseudomonadota bacterium]
MFRSIALTAFLALIICSCGRASQQSATTQAAKPHQPPSVIQQQTPPPSQPDTTTQQTEVQQASAAQEKGEDEPEDDPRAARGDSGLERLAQMPADQQLPAGKWKPGVNYDPLVPAQPTTVGPGKVEVVEVFWLGCPHCAALEPYIQSWLKNKPSYIEFVRVPVMWGPAHRAHAHLFYTIAALNRQDLVQKAFDAIQNQHQMLFAQSDDDTLKAQVAWATSNGIKADDYTKAYNSFSVNSNLQRAEQLTQRYHVEGVPLIVINGKYTTDVAKANGQGPLIQLIDDLAAAEHKH